MEKNNEETEEKKGILYIVSTPIGNWDDITLRAIKILKNCDKVVCEEGKEGARILKQYNIHKEIELLNEQNEEEGTLELIMELEKGKRLALISDCGTPVFADPGYKLVKSAISRNIEIIVIPGASSLMAGIVRSGFPINEFLFAGFLNRNKEDRLAQLRELSKEKRTVALLETPYRLVPFLEATKTVMPFRNAYIGCNLTMPFETHHYGTFSELYERFSFKKFKGEFIVVFEGLPGDGSISKEWDVENQRRKEMYSDEHNDRDSREFNRRSKYDGKGSRGDDRRGSSDDRRGRSGFDSPKSNDGRKWSDDKKQNSDNRKTYADRKKYKSEDNRGGKDYKGGRTFNKKRKRDGN